MPARWLWGLVLAALWSTATPLRAAEVPQAVLQQCAAVKPALKGWPALRAHCPGLARALKQLGVQGLLPIQWRTTLRSDGLEGLAALAHHYGAAPRSRPPNPAVLRDIARALAVPAPAPSAWDRIRLWWAHWSAPLQQWLRQRLRAVLHGPARVQLLHTLLGFLLALLGTLTLLGVYFGRRAGLFDRIARRAARTARVALPHHAVAGPRPPPDWSALGTQPAQILRVLVEALVNAGRLEREQHLTCRELTAQAHFETRAQREEFAQLARLAERERYGPPAVTRVPDSVLQRIPALYAQCRRAHASDCGGAS